MKQGARGGQNNSRNPVDVVGCRKNQENLEKYNSTTFSSFMSSNGIFHQASCAYTPQQNGVAKCKNRHLVETTCILLLHHKVPQCF